MLKNRSVMALPWLALSLLLAGCGNDAAGPPAEEAVPEAEVAEHQEPALPEVGALIQQALQGEHRSEQNKARDEYRNPLETLIFFGLQPDMTVVEFWPGGGWYTEVLAPVLHEHGQLVLASFPEEGGSEFTRRSAQALREKLDSAPEVYGNVDVVPFLLPDHASLGPDASADLVLISRHFHNLIAQGIEDEVLQAAYEVLRPGGTLAILQHRADHEAVPESEERNGYVREQYVIERAASAGFILSGRSEINANDNDTRDHPAGVWTLPPTLRYCAQMEDEDEKAECEAHYRNIGESDRMTIRFTKPE